MSEVVADLHLTTYREVIGEIIPELRLGEDDEHAMTFLTGTPVLATPEVDEAIETAFVMGKVDAPYTRKLEAAVGTGIFIALEVLLIHKLYRPGL